MKEGIIMNPEKIGKFISVTRKKKKMTQEELANRVHVSNKTISKWETGRGLPDYSSLSNLCKVLDISVVELLNGESTKKEEGLVEYLKYKENKSKKNKILVAGISLLLIILFILSVYFINSYKKINVYSLAGESENFVYENGLLFISNIKNIMESGHLTSKEIEQENIIDAVFAVKIEEEFYFVSSYKENITLEEDYGYSEILSKEKRKYLPDNLYLLIYYKEGNNINIEQLKIENEKIMSNDKLLNYKSKSIGEKEEDYEKPIDLSEYDNYGIYKKRMEENGFKIEESNLVINCDECYVKKISEKEYIGFNSYSYSSYHYYLEEKNLMIKSGIFKYNEDKESSLSFLITTEEKMGYLNYDFINKSITGDKELMKYADNITRAIELYEEYKEILYK